MQLAQSWELVVGFHTSCGSADDFFSVLSGTTAETSPGRVVLVGAPVVASEVGVTPATSPALVGAAGVASGADMVSYKTIRHRSKGRYG